MEVPKWGTGAEPLAAGSGAKPPESEETLQVVHVEKSILWVTHVVPKRRDGYITCDAL